MELELELRSFWNTRLALLLSVIVALLHNKSVPTDLPDSALSFKFSSGNSLMELWCRGNETLSAVELHII